MLRHLESLKDELDPSLKNRVSKMWGKNVLQNSPAQKTSHIQLGKWELSESDKQLVLDTFFYGIKINSIKKFFESLPKELETDIKKSVIKSESKIWDNVNINKPTLGQIKSMYTNSFTLIDSKSTLSDKVVLKDEDGKPILDKNSKIQMVTKSIGEVVWTKNISDFTAFLDSWVKSRVVSKASQILSSISRNKIDVSFIKSNEMSPINSCLSDNIGILDFNIFSEDKMYLYITDKPSDTLNMSVSQFFTSCQHLWSDNSYNKSLLVNIFDINMVPAFIIYDTPYKNEKGKVLNKFTPICRLIIRKLEGPNNTTELYFDRCYPDRMQNPMKSIIEKLTTNKNTWTGHSTYIIKSDVSQSFNLPNSYQDHLRAHREPYFGKNIKSLDDDSLRLNHDFRYSKEKILNSISPDNMIERIVINKRNIDFWMDILKDNTLFKNVKWLEIEGITPDENLNNYVWENSLSIRSMNGNISKFPDSINRLEILSCFSDDTTCPDLPLSVKELTMCWSYLYLPKNILDLNLLKLKISSNLKKYNSDILSQLSKKINIIYDEGL